MKLRANDHCCTETVGRVIELLNPALACPLSLIYGSTELP